MKTSACLLSKEQIRQWIVDLRSGEFQQVKGSLHDGVGGYCCLGVLAQRLGTLEEARSATEIMVVRGKRVVGRESKLMDMNDNFGKTFPEIADFIEQEILPGAPEQMVEGALLPFYDTDDSEDSDE